MSESRVFPALLKYWRGARGMSQLDLSLAAGVSARHISFLETGRSSPSEEMVLRLGATLGVPLREQNALLRAAGFAERFEEDAELSPRLAEALDRMMRAQEPYPLVVMNRLYDVVQTNRAGALLMSRILKGDLPRLSAKGPLNALRLTFEERGLRPHIENWDALARNLLIRLQREVLQNPADTELAGLLEELLDQPGVPDDWHVPDLGKVCDPTVNVRFRCEGRTLEFLTTLTTFNAPQNVALQELQIESYYPIDGETEAFCREISDRDAT